MWKLWQKTLVMINRFEACDHYDIDFLSEFVKTFRLPFFSFWLIFPLAMVGMIQGIARDRKSRAVSCLLAVYALTLIVVFHKQPVSSAHGHFAHPLRHFQHDLHGGILSQQKFPEGRQLRRSYPVIPDCRIPTGQRYR